MRTTFERPQPPPVPPWSPTAPTPPQVDVRPPFVFIQPVWEYQHLVWAPAGDPTIEAGQLNQLGAEGWELVNVIFDGQAQHLYLKRQIR